MRIPPRDTRRGSCWHRTTGVVAGFLAIVGASGSATGSPYPGDPESAGSADYEWVEVTYGGGAQVDVAVFKPEDYSDSGNHPLILALPWGKRDP